MLASDCDVEFETGTTRLHFLTSLEENERSKILVEELQALSSITHRHITDANSLLNTCIASNEVLRRRLQSCQLELRTARATETLRAQRERENETELLVTVSALKERLVTLKKQHTSDLLQKDADRENDIAHLQSTFAYQLESAGLQLSSSPSPSRSITSSLKIESIAYFSVRIRPRITRWVRCRGAISNRTVELRPDGFELVECALHCIGPLHLFNDEEDHHGFGLSFSHLDSLIQCSFGTREDRARWAHSIRVTSQRNDLHVDTVSLQTRRAQQSSFTKSTLAIQARLTSAFDHRHKK
ncbi:Hypothetical protein, putative [Bodo saltans]|uniref:Uncharacterized protein n=1 Tax=Bodo saltans TaxID=75058 RepID=A0A0S4JNZ6_BODSA|nr:Hypothetical protein, putative [Bodo saltans]|eukprot:CUG91650.1 Hypothetical protein, putative [Bodo saltans]